jgi:similar to stage IV sporulation protein
VAEVTVKEIDFIIKEEPKYDASNLVSTANGIIVGFEEIKGNIGVKIGDSVSKGQLLVGGIYGDEENGFRYTNADGRVLAETERVFEDRISRNFLKKRYTGRQKSEKYLIFFKKEVKFFGNCRNLYGNYDKIEVEEYLPSMGEHDLPVGIRTVTYLEYEYTEETRTDNELLSVAKYKQSADIERTLKDAELLSKKESFVIDKDGITLTTKVKTIENIAKRQEIEIDFF